MLVDYEIAAIYLACKLQDGHIMYTERDGHKTFYVLDDETEIDGACELYEYEVPNDANVISGWQDVFLTPCNDGDTMRLVNRMGKMGWSFHLAGKTRFTYKPHNKRAIVGASDGNSNYDIFIAAYHALRAMERRNAKAKRQ